MLGEIVVVVVRVGGLLLVNVNVFVIRVIITVSAAPFVIIPYLIIINISPLSYIIIPRLVTHRRGPLSPLTIITTSLK